jgi:Ubiquinol cytochrome reductase transmembrane region
VLLPTTTSIKNIDVDQNYHRFNSISPNRPSAHLNMPPLTSTAGHLVRCCARQRLPAIRASTALIQHRSQSSQAHWDTTKIPNFDHYKSKGKEEDNRVFSYVMAGTLGAVTAMGAKATVVGMISPGTRFTRSI